MNFKNIFLLLAGVIFSLSLFSQTFDANSVDGKIYFKLNDNVSKIYTSNGSSVDLDKVAILSSLISKYQITSISRPFHTAEDLKLERTYAIKFDNFSMINQLIKDLEDVPTVDYAEKAPLFKISFTPNDAEYGSVNKRWHLDVINSEQAWDLETGNSNIKVAVLDNAVWTGHPDLVNKIIAEVDVADNDNDATPGSQTGMWSHGTHVSGLVAAETNNSIGIASIGYDISILAVKCAENTSTGQSVSSGYEGIVWATDNEADVINMSWGGSFYYQTGQNTVNYAYNKGVVLVAAAGNDNVSTLHYPSAYNHVISVASTDSDDEKSGFSNYGASIDICSPGGYNASWQAIYSTTYTNAPNATYDDYPGTSMASPIAAGLCGLMLSADSSLTPEKLEAILKVTCDNIYTQNPGYTNLLGAGRINAFAAITAVIDSLTNGTGSNGIIADFLASTTVVSEGNDVIFTDTSTGPITGWSWSFQGGTPATSTLQNPTITYNSPGTYDVSLTVTDGTNNNTETKSNIITVNSTASSAWIPQASGFSTASRGINYISIVDANIVWATAYDGGTTSSNVQEFTKTINGGTTWIAGTIDLGDLNLGVAMVHAISADIAWAVGFPQAGSGNGGIWKTIDGGSSWNRQNTAAFNSSSAFSNVVYFWDANNGFCQGDPDTYFELYTTTDGGTTWVRVPQANIPPFLPGEYGYTSQIEVVGDNVWFTTNKGRIYHSTDKGYNFNVYDTPLTDFGGGTGESGEVSFKNDTIGVAINNLGKVYGTYDAGANWTTLNTNASGNVFGGGVCYIENTEMVVSVGANTNSPGLSGSSYSSDGGVTWDTLDSVQHLYVDFLDAQTGWSGWFNTTSTDAGMWKWIGVPVGDYSAIVREDIITIYPNPNNGIFNIKLSNIKEDANIEVYNLMGKMVYKQTDKNMSNENVLTIDLSNLAKGVYIAVVKSGLSVNTEKVIIK